MLVSTVELAWRARRAGALGVTGAAGVDLDWGAIIARKNRIVASWSEGKEAGLARQGIAVLRGHARFVGPHEVEVGDRRITTERVVVATGSSPERPPIAGIERALTSAELLERTTRPERMAVIGGGVIAMELSFAFGRAGTRVTVLARSHVLPAVDEDLRAALMSLAPEARVDVQTGVRVTRVAADHTVEAEIEGRVERFPADVVLVAAGRSPNVAGLGLDAAGVTLERGGVKVNEFRQSTIAGSVFDAMWD